MINDNKNEEVALRLCLSIWPLKSSSGFSRCRNANPVPTNPFVDDLTIAPSRPMPSPSKINIRFFMVDPLNYFSFQPVLHVWYNKDRGMCYPVCGMVSIK